MGNLLRLQRYVLAILACFCFLVKSQTDYLKGLISQIDYDRISAIKDLSDRLTYKATTLEDFLGWSANLSGNVPYDGAVTARLSTELTYDLSAQSKADRQNNNEKQLNTELYAIYIEDIKRQTELAIVNTYCFTQYANTIMRIFEQYKQLAASDVEVAFWEARIRQMLHDLENLQWELKQFLTDELSQIPVLETICHLEETFDLSTLLAIPDVESHPRVREMVINSKLNQYQAEFFNTPASASLFLRSSADVGFSPQSTTRFSVNLGLQVPLDVKLDTVRADLTTSVSETGFSVDVGMNKAFEEDLVGDATSENEKQLRLKRHEVESSIKSAQLAYETNQAREKLAWIKLPGYCSNCEIDIEAIENPDVLDALFEAVNASFERQNAMIQLFDVQSILPSTVFQ